MAIEFARTVSAILEWNRKDNLISVCLHGSTTDSLAFHQEALFYRSLNGTPPSELLKEQDANEVFEEVKWVINAVKKIIK